MRFLMAMANRQKEKESGGRIPMKRRMSIDPNLLKHLEKHRAPDPSHKSQDDGSQVGQCEGGVPTYQ